MGNVERFDNLEGQEPLWRIPKERMKMRRDHIVPLSPQAVEILLELRKLTGNGQYMVSAPTNTGVISENTMLYAIYRMGYHSRATAHGFRTTASTSSSSTVTGLKCSWRISTAVSGASTMLRNGYQVVAT